MFFATLLVLHSRSSSNVTCFQKCHIIGLLIAFHQCSDVIPPTGCSYIYNRKVLIDITSIQRTARARVHG